MKKKSGSINVLLIGNFERHGTASDFRVCYF